MNRLIVYILLLLTAANMRAEDTLRIVTHSIDVNKTDAAEMYFSIEMENVRPYQALQFDIVLPTGITLKEDTPFVLNSERFPKNNETMEYLHQVDYQELGLGCVRVIISANDIATIVGEAGELLKVYFDIPKDGEYTIGIDNIILAISGTEAIRPNNSSSVLTVKKVILGDVNGDGEVDVTDVVLTISYILDEDPVDFNPAAANMNDDEDIDVTDVVLMINKILE